MTITIDIPDKKSSEKVISFLKTLEKDGVKIIKKSKKEELLQEFDEIVKYKSEDSILLDQDSILNPHKELSSDIS